METYRYKADVAGLTETPQFESVEGGFKSELQSSEARKYFKPEVEVEFMLKDLVDVNIALEEDHPSSCIAQTSTQHVEVLAHSDVPESQRPTESILPSLPDEPDMSAENILRTSTLYSLGHNIAPSSWHGWSTTGDPVMKTVPCKHYW